MWSCESHACLLPLLLLGQDCSTLQALCVDRLLLCKIFAHPPNPTCGRISPQPCRPGSKHAVSLPQLSAFLFQLHTVSCFSPQSQQDPSGSPASQTSLKCLMKPAGFRSWGPAEPPQALARASPSTVLAHACANPSQFLRQFHQA